MGHPVLVLGVDWKENTSASRNAEGIRWNTAEPLRLPTAKPSQTISNPYPISIVKRNQGYPKEF